MFEGWERRTICHMAAATASLAFRDSDVCKTESRTTIFCCPYSSALLNHYLLRADPALTVQHAWGPTSLQHKTRHIQVNVHTGLPTVVSPTTDTSCFRRSRVNQAQKVPKQRLLRKAAKVTLLSRSTWWCENSLLLKLSAHPAGTELPPSLPPSQGVPMFNSRRWNLSKNIGAIQEDH